jgi:hypothetical protein
MRVLADKEQRLKRFKVLPTPMSFPQVHMAAAEFPSTVLRLLGIMIPEGLSPANEDILSRFSPKAVVIVMIDNFGLFEAVVYKPEALLKNMELLALIETADPYAIPLTNEVIRGANDFHLIRYVKDYGKVTQAICREEDMPSINLDKTCTIDAHDDMATYVESTKHISKSDLLFLHFLDFESLYAQYGHRTPPKTLLEKIVRRTDNWIKVLLRQARLGTLFVVIGNHGRHPVPLDYEGKLAEWRSANAPIAMMFQKRTE